MGKKNKEKFNEVLNEPIHTENEKISQETIQENSYEELSQQLEKDVIESLENDEDIKEIQQELEDMKENVEKIEETFTNGPEETKETLKEMIADADAITEKIDKAIKETKKKMPFKGINDFKNFWYETY